MNLRIKKYLRFTTSSTFIERKSLLKALGVGLGTYDLTSLGHKIDNYFISQNSSLILNKWKLELVDIKAVDYVCYVCYSYSKPKKMVYKKFILD